MALSRLKKSDVVALVLHNIRPEYFDTLAEYQKIVLDAVKQGDPSISPRYVKSQATREYNFYK